MTQEEKQLLLKDLSSRLTYSVKISAPEVINDATFTVVGITNLNSYSSIPCVCCIKDDTQAYIEIPLTCKILPYLRPMSSMTEEEKQEYHTIIMRFQDCSFENGESATTMVNDWLLSKHFDTRGLIPKGLAIKVTEENNPYKD